MRPESRIIAEALVRATETEGRYRTSPFFKAAIDSLSELLVPMVRGLVGESKDADDRFQKVETFLRRGKI